MKRTLAVALLIFLAGVGYGSRVKAGGRCVVPESWGTFRHAYFAPGNIGSYEGLVFESSDGTIRALSASKCDPTKPIFEVFRK